ncbi:hypothetical protein SK128_015792 [Halocaridina rubra]|uniref:CUB domain-containing protein n=1 Tax=Halocaridina rubra TaxID=373956 RepID=A0AAN8ZRC9_HALRR
MKLLSVYHKHLYLVTAAVLFIESTTAAPQLESPQEDAHDVTILAEDEQQETNRDEKVLISLVTVEPKPCNSDAGIGDIGTCMTSSDCKFKGGTAAGSCANGLGTCCIVTRTCLDATRLNNTYFTSPLLDGVGACTLTVHRASTNICQMRLDFVGMRLSQPDPDGNCNTDFFTVTGGTNNIPIICGDNTGQHMYINVEANGGPVKLTVDRSTTGSSIRSWNIKVTQLLCNSRYRAPDSCLQYFTETSGTVQSFNYDVAVPVVTPPAITGTRQIANQDYGVCIQKAAGYCGIVWERDANAGGYSFTVSGNVEALQPGLEGTPDASAKGDLCTDDYIVIPGGIDDLDIRNDTYCGLGFPKFVTSTATPFVLYIKNNDNEIQDGLNHGFRLTYRQKTC